MTTPGETVDGETTPRLLAEWRNRVAADVYSAAITAQVVHWMIQVGLPGELISLGLRIVQDELDHATRGDRRSNRMKPFDPIADASGRRHGRPRW